MGTAATGRRGYLLGLEGLTLFDGPYSPESRTWLQALPLGKYQHPRYGELDITPSKIERMAKNFHDNVREQELDVDYDHKAKDGRAAGWVKDAEVREDGLWIAVSWTEPAYAALKAGEYKYFSSEFTDSWTHPKTKVTHQDVLFGGGITNRPFIKDILPINLTEVLEHEGGIVDEALKQLLRKKYQLADDADEATILAAVELDEQDPETEDESEEDEESEEESDEESTEASEDDDPRIKTLMERLNKQDKQIIALQEVNKRSETKRKLSELTAGGTKHGIPTKVLADLEGVMINMSTKDADKLLDVFKEIQKTGTVELGERGSSNPGREEGHEDSSRSVWNLVEKAMKADSDLNEVDAYEKVLSENPDLYEQYRREAATKGDL